MAKYNPDCWIPVLIESAEYGKVYKILASWYGGFAAGDSWKLSSGIEAISRSEDGTLTMPQSSGSVYVVSDRPHRSSLIQSMYSEFERELVSNGHSFKEVSLNELLDAFSSTD